MKKLFVFLLLTICVFSAFSATLGKWHYYTGVKDGFGDIDESYLYKGEFYSIQLFFDDSGFNSGRIFIDDDWFNSNDEIYSCDFYTKDDRGKVEKIKGKFFDGGSYIIKDGYIERYFDKKQLKQIVKLFKNNSNPKMSVDIYKGSFFKGDGMTYKIGEINCLNFKTKPNEIRRQI